jgi:hypothetical protein
VSKRLIAVVTCHQRVYPQNDLAGGHKNGESRIDVVRATWFRHWLCLYADRVDLKFFLGRGDRSPRDHEIYLDCDDSYYGLPEKVRKTYNWCYRAGYDQVIKVDDDVFVYLDRLLANLTDDSYRGYAIESDMKYASGTCYQLDRRAMKLVADAEIPQGEWREDRHVGTVLARNGIQLVHEERFHCCHCEHCKTLVPESQRISSHTADPREMYRLMETSNV